VTSVDVTGLVSLRKYFTRGAQVAAIGTVISAGAFVAPEEIPDRGWAGMLAVLLATAWFVLRRGRFAAARVVVTLLFLVIGFLLWRQWWTMSSPASDAEFITVFYLAVFMFVPFQGALGLLMPDARAATRSPYARGLFTRTESLRARLMRRMRGVRLLPVVVVLLMLVALVGLSVIVAGQPRERALAARRAAQMVLAVAGGAALLWARRRSARRGAVVRRGDSRPPVLLLRSFGDDMMRLETGAKWTRTNDILRRGMTFERIVVKHLDSIGPVIAIGKPGEALAPLGAARDYVGDEVWQQEVEQRMREAALIVLMLGTSEGLAWELLRVRRLQLLHKLVLVFPPAGNLEERWLTLLARDLMAGSTVLPETLDPSRVLTLVWDDDGRPLAVEGPRTEWAYETVIRLAMLFGRLRRGKG
jgi:hypothetical protein